MRNGIINLHPFSPGRSWLGSYTISPNSSVHYFTHSVWAAHPPHLHVLRWDFPVWYGCAYEHFLNSEKRDGSFYFTVTQSKDHLKNSGCERKIWCCNEVGNIRYKILLSWPCTDIFWCRKKISVFQSREEIFRNYEIPWLCKIYINNTSNW